MPNRDRIFATSVTGTGAATTFSVVGYTALRSQILAWGDAYGYDFTTSAAAGMDSKAVNGFSAEGMVFGSDNTTLYIGLRAPLVPTSSRTKAVIVPISNFETWFNNGAPSGNATFGSPIELDLGGRGIRELLRLSNGTYIIIAGNPAGSPLTSAIYKWTGSTGDAPVQVITSADALLNMEGVMQVNTGGTLALDKLQVISDGGDDILYNDGSEAKDFAALSLRKFRSDLLSSLDLSMTTTGLQESVAGSDMQLAPNPTRGKVQVTLATNQKMVSAAIYNLTGEKVKTIVLNSDDSQFTLDLQDLTTGTYLIVFKENNGKQTTRRIIKI